MDYIVFDMEWNQSPNGRRLWRSGMPVNGEIVQIGAVKLDENFLDRGTFNIIVRPKYYTRMNKMIQEMTGIDDDALAGGVRFPEAVKRFREWCGDDYCYVTWGPDDRAMLLQNLRLHGMEDSWMPKCYNLQVVYNAQVSQEKNMPSLKTAVEALNIVLEEQFHDALNDARYTAKICQALDMRKGLAGYSEKKPKDEGPRTGSVVYKDQHLTEQRYYGYKYLREGLADPRVLRMECPVCGEKLVPAGPWVWQGDDKRIRLAACGDHGVYLGRIRVQKKENRFCLGRVLFEADDDLRSLYEARLIAYNTQQRQRERRKAARQERGEAPVAVNEEEDEALRYTPEELAMIQQDDSELESGMEQS